MTNDQLLLKADRQTIFKIAFPIVISMAIPQLNFLVNSMFLGRLGENALGVAVLTGVYYLLFAVIGNGLNSSLQAILSKFAGMNNRNSMNLYFQHGLVVAIGLSVIGIGFTYLFVEVLFRYSIHNPVLQEEVCHFLKIRIWGLPFLYVYQLRSALLVSSNMPKFLIIGTTVETLTNIFFDYTFIFGKWGFPNLGINGAAYASILAEISGLLSILFIINKQEQFKGLFRPLLIGYDTSILLDILKKSISLVLLHVISVGSWEYFFILIEHQGDRALAVSNVMRNVYGLFGVSCWAFGSTTNTILSNLLGQGDQKGYFKGIFSIMKWSILATIVIVLMLHLSAIPFLRLFGLPDTFVQDAMPILRIVASALFLTSISVVLFNAVIATEKTWINLLIEVITITAYMLYTYYVLEVVHLGVVWAWGAEIVYWALTICLSSIYLIYLYKKILYK